MNTYNYRKIYNLIRRADLLHDIIYSKFRLQIMEYGLKLWRHEHGNQFAVILRILPANSTPDLTQGKYQRQINDVTEIANQLNLEARLLGLATFNMVRQDMMYVYGLFDFSLKENKS